MSEELNDSVLSHKYIERDDYLDPVLYTVKEAARLLKTNVDYIHSLRKAGLLPFLKLGQFKIRREALMDFLLKYEGYDLSDPFCVKEINNGET